MTLRLKILFGMAGLALVAGIAIKLNQAAVGRAVLERVVGERVGRDATAGLPDGLHLALCGTGSPLPNAARAGPCQLIIAGKTMFVVDIGEGGARNLALMGMPMGRINAVFLTHFHSDHFDGLGPLLLLRWTGSAATAPLPVFGPTGVEALVTGINAAYGSDNSYRTAHHGAKIVPPAGAGGIAQPFATPEEGAPKVIYDASGVKVTAFLVDHGPVKPAVGYRFDYKGRSIVISGDTKPVPEMVPMAKDVDLLVHEALQPALVAMMTEGLEARGSKNTAQITRDILNYHTSPEDAARIAARANARQLVLTHIVPPIPSRLFYPAFLGDAPNLFSGPVIVGEDGMIFSLPSGKQAIDRKMLF